MPFRRRAESRLAGAALCAALLLGACSANPVMLRFVEPSPQRGGTLKVALAGDLDSLDPHRASSPASWFFARALHRGLLAFPNEPFPAGARPVPDLAAALPSVDASGTTVTFTLRPALFANGSAITAGDVRASLERALRIDGSDARYLWVIAGARAFVQRRAARVTGIATPDARTVTLTLTASAPDLPWVLAHPAFAILPAGTALRAAPAGIVGAGPYRLASYLPERSITLVRNERWSLDRVREANVDRIEATVSASPDAAMRAAIAGRADVVAEPGPPDVRPTAPPTARIATAPSGCVRYLFSNGLSAAARAAIAGAVDPAALPGTDGSIVVGGNPLPPAMFGGGEPDARPRPARASLRTTLVAGDSPRDRADAAAVRSMLARAGVVVSLRFVAPALLYTSTFAPPARGVAIGLASWCADWPGLAGRAVLDALTGHTVEPPTPGCRSAAVDRLRARAVAAAPADQAAAWDSVAAAMPACGIVTRGWPVETGVLSQRVRGFTGAPMFPRGDPTGLWLG